MGLFNLFTFWPQHLACDILVPDQESNLPPPHWTHRVLTTEPLRNSLSLLLNAECQGLCGIQEAGFNLEGLTRESMMHE